MPNPINAVDSQTPSIQFDRNTSTFSNQDFSECEKMVNELLDVKRGQPPIRRLHAILVRLSEIAENHIQENKIRDLKKKSEIEEKVKEIRKITKEQGWVYGLSGIGGSVLSLLAALALPADYKEIASVASHLAQPISQAFNQHLESDKQGPDFDKQRYLQLITSEKQALEGFKNLPQQLQQKLMHLLQLEREAIRASNKG